MTVLFRIGLLQRRRRLTLSLFTFFLLGAAGNDLCGFRQSFGYCSRIDCVASFFIRDSGNWFDII